MNGTQLLYILESIRQYVRNNWISNTKYKTSIFITVQQNTLLY